MACKEDTFQSGTRSAKSTNLTIDFYSEHRKFLKLRALAFVSLLCDYISVNATPAAALCACHHASPTPLHCSSSNHEPTWTLLSLKKRRKSKFSSFKKELENHQRIGRHVSPKRICGIKYTKEKLSISLAFK